MGKLLDQHKAFIVVEFACYRTATMIKTALKESFSVEAELHHILYYNPERTTGGTEKLGKKWRKIFESARAQYVSDISSIGIANQRYRMDVLQKILDNELEGGIRNKGLVLEILERGAKETGGAYTNQRVLTGKGGGPIVTAGMTLDQWKEQAANNMAQAQETMATFGDDG